MLLNCYYSNSIFKWAALIITAGFLESKQRKRNRHKREYVNLADNSIENFLVPGGNELVLPFLLHAFLKQSYLDVDKKL